MVSADKNAGGGAFSINVVNNVVLDGRYVVFGTVIAGMDVVDVISQVPTDSNEAPKTPVVIESVSIS
jgi:peptidyl-prolyl cis-trans isomerase A (cyclophilin A)